MSRSPDIELTDSELSLLGQIAFDWSTHDEIRASIMPMVALAESLLKRGAIPEVRKLYFTDPERNPSGRGRSRQQIFEGNGTSGPEILAHPHFLPYLRYFIYGPKLPSSIIEEFKQAASWSSYLSGHDVQELTSKAKAVVKQIGAEPHSTADEFHKLALECGAMPSTAATLRQSIRTVRLPHRR